MSPIKRTTTQSSAVSAAAEESQSDSTQQGAEAGPASEEATAPQQEQSPSSDENGIAEHSDEKPTSAELEARIESLEDQLLRAKADFQNLQRRSATEQAEAVRFANASLMRSLLSVVDDLQRSLAAAEESDDAATLRDGVRLAYENFMKALADHGLEAIDSLNEPFDPAIHNAMMQSASTEHPPGTVIEEVAKGYRLRDRVLRAAMVIVSKDAEQESSGTGEPVDR